MLSDKIALFDFCETLANFQTADAFVRYVLEKREGTLKKGVNYWTQILLEKTKVSAVLYRLGSNVNKFMLLKNLKGLTRDQLLCDAKEYYEEKVKPNLIKETVSELREKQSQGYRCVIVSGGYDVYLRRFVDEFGINQLICSELKFEDEIFTGQLATTDCMGKEKVHRLEKAFGVNNLKDCDSISYSDSSNDIPFLCFTRRAVVVTRKVPKWVSNYKFDIKLWKE